MSIQLAILKVLASHDGGRTTTVSLKRDIAILATSGHDWNARMKRLAGRVRAIDIFGSGYVRRDDEGWEITAEGRDFLLALEAVTQDNLPTEADPPPSIASNSVEAARASGALIVVGHRFKSRHRRSRAPALPGPLALSGEA